MSSEHVAVHEGRRLRYLTMGSGEPLLLFHGFLGSAENFETWFAGLATRRTLVIPDLPGFGASDPLRDRAHIAESLCDAVEPLLHDLGIERYDVGGLCLGASPALVMAQRHAGAVRKLILHTPLLDPSLVRRRFHVQAGVMTAPGVFGSMIWLSRRRVVSDLYKRLMVEGSDVDRAAADMNFRNQTRAEPRASREWLRDGLRRRDLDALASRRGDTLILAAAGDKIVDVAALGAVARRMPGVQLAVIEEAGHGWNADFVRRQLDVLTAFLDGSPLPEQALAPQAVTA
ncbi:MAG TPA: alpha/beta fold hydrolase [Candidatus Dormibacteraeota bacterium]|nr:alpha/beta fold hydrolase [Candidatus Dormibacteraeota bacterium]